MSQLEDTTKTVNGQERRARRFGPEGRAYVCTEDGDCTEADQKALAWAKENGLLDSATEPEPPAEPEPVTEPEPPAQPEPPAGPDGSDRDLTEAVVESMLAPLEDRETPIYDRLARLRRGLSTGARL